MMPSHETEIIGFILAFAAAAVLTIIMVVFGRWGEVESRCC
jgi:hypothetical protein